MIDKSGFNAASALLDDSCDPYIRGFLHSPATANSDGLILTHGAGSNCNAPLLIAVAETFAAHGYTILRCDLPFRQERPTGAPFPGNSERDRAGLRNAIVVMRKLVTGRVFLGGHSYGGRQASMLAAGDPDLVAGLLLLSYPLHPPRKSQQLRTQHFPILRTPCLFVHGTRDPFGSIEELTKALQLIPAKHNLLEVQGAGHDLGFKGKSHPQALTGDILNAFTSSNMLG